MASADVRHEAREDDFPDDPRLMEAVQAFEAELAAGRRPSRQEYLRRYPDLAGPLGQCLDGLELVHLATPRSDGARNETPVSGDALPAESELRTWEDELDPLVLGQ